MELVDTLYEWLCGDPSPDVDEIFAVALEQAEPPYAARIVAVLLHRGTATAWAGLITNYDRLTPDVRLELQTRPELLRDGAALALRSGTTRGRMNTLSLLAEHPCPEVAPMIAEALRDPALRVREVAAALLRDEAAQMLPDAPTGQQRGPGASSQTALQRAALLRALREALRTFEVHLRLDVLEACLWYAKELGSPLWDTLAARRSRSGYAVEQHLAAWSGPRLAAFLLLALGQPRWQRQARAALRPWSTRPELLALLDQSDLLANPVVAHHFHVLKRPRWLAAADPALSNLPRAARAQVPYWICHLGFTETERLCYLRRWLASSFPELQRATVYALASLGTPGATQLLKEIGAGSGPLAQFAQWYVAGAAPPDDPVTGLPPAKAQGPVASEVRA